MQKATFAGGCFWCTQAIFKRLRGVKKVTVGYSGGESDSPTYESIGHHAEAIQIEFEPKEISYADLLYVFFRTHDPTQMNRQGPDTGEQYRSVVFYHDDTQRATVLTAIKDAQKQYADKIVTQIKKFTAFFPAEDYHQDYYEKNKSLPYCRLVIDPKIKELEKDFKPFLKT